MAHIDAANLDAVERYRLLIGAVVPRPIAWVSTVDAQGRVNLAPFSFFNGVTASPPTLMISIGYRPQTKDTLANLRATNEAVVHLVPAHLLAQCHQSGGEYAPGVSEAEQLSLATTPASQVRPPRLVEAEVAMECRLLQEVAIGDPAAPATVVFLQILCAHIADECMAADGLPDPDRLRAVARLGDRAYLDANAWQVVHQEKQQVPKELARKKLAPRRQS